MRITQFLGGSLLALAVSSPALAQNSGNPGVAKGTEANDPNDIIVTATKRETTLQETPIAVSVVGKKAIEDAQIRDLLDIQTLVPSLAVSQNENLISTSFSIRGFGNGGSNPGIEPSVGVFIDGVYRPRGGAQVSDLPNVERVEVLRGPQSTLFGKNASAGVVSVITQEPKFKYGGSVSATYGNFNQVVLKGDVTGPITSQVAFSLSGNYNSRDGYARDLNTRAKFNDRNRYGVRGQLLFHPTDALKIRLIADYDKIDENCCISVYALYGPTGPAIDAIASGGHIIQNMPFSDTTRNNIVARNLIENYGTSGHIDYDLGHLTISSITAYREFKSNSISDGDLGPADILGDNLTDTNINTFSQELRLVSNFDGPLNFVVGGFYYNEKLKHQDRNLFGRDARPYLNILSQGGIRAVESILGLPVNTFTQPGVGDTNNYRVNDRTYSVFGTVDYKVTDRITLTGGLAYTKDEKDAISNVITTDAFSAIDLVALGVALGVPPALANTSANPLLPLQGLQFLPPFLNFPNAVESGKTRDGKLSYTARAAYKFSDHLNGYVSYATGFKASSFNVSQDSRPPASIFIPGSPASSPPPPSSPVRDAGLALPNLTTGTRFAGPENSRVFEVGLKGNFHFGSFNLAVFDQQIKGFQSVAFTGTGFALTNAGSRTARGAELDVTVNPVKPLSLFFAMTYLHNRYDSFTGSPYGDLSGEKPTGIPTFSFSTGGSYTHQFNDGTKLSLRMDYLHESKVQIVRGFSGFSQAAGFAAAKMFTREVNLVNASTTLALNSGFELSVYARNLFNTRYYTAVGDAVAQPGSVTGYPNDPRTYGITGRFKF
ncbi:TonB-dependent receptor [Sphingomonas sp.]|uniref:TonB-dependent receptor n=1 Tax=Sphingomonas sp. TaxID=28214 RepID=UPI0025E11278|nr:TonB-dependent receptor [Sphingomonas sp.]